MKKGSFLVAVPTPKSGQDGLTHTYRKLSRKQLINKLNAINFRQGEILVILKHNRFDKTITFSALPQPCTGEQLDCLWGKPQFVPDQIEDYSCIKFLINDGQSSYSVIPEATRLTDEIINFVLPQNCTESAVRQIRRYSGSDIQVQFIQNGSLFTGHLNDFSSVSFRINLAFSGHQSARWLNPEEPGELILKKDDTLLYADNCKIIRDSPDGSETHTLIVEPTRKIISRYRPKEFRSTRQKLLPTPSAAFEHPLSGKQVNLPVADISGTGFSIIESEVESLMIPGMIIPELKLSFSGNFYITCCAQVVYRLPVNCADDQIRSGTTFLDMPPEDHMQLLALLHRAEDEQASFCQEIAPEKLWNFFFESGFLYPEKYVSVVPDISEFKKTYLRLYNSSSTIARHFIHQSQGHIVAHMAALRFYKNAWMLHHHAANNIGSAKAGINVLNQTGRWANDTRSLKSGHFNYFFCYYQEKNRFPRRIFGGLADRVNDRKICSVDRFAYYHHEIPIPGDCDLCPPWSLSRITDEDVQEFNYYYQSISGGLLPQALDLLPETHNDNSLNEEYREHGFKRDRTLYALRENGTMRAFIAVNNADIGLNMSDLTSAFHVFILDPDSVPRSVIDLILSLLCCKTEKKKVPILLYPESYAEKVGIESQKSYSLLIFDTEHFDHYFRHLQSLIKNINH